MYQGENLTVIFTFNHCSDDTTVALTSPGFRIGWEQNVSITFAPIMHRNIIWLIYTLINMSKKNDNSTENGSIYV